MLAVAGGGGLQPGNGWRHMREHLGVRAKLLACCWWPRRFDCLAAACRLPSRPQPRPPPRIPGRRSGQRSKDSSRCGPASPCLSECFFCALSFACTRHPPNLAAPPPPPQLLCVSLKVSTIVKEAKAALEGGYAGEREGGDGRGWAGQGAGLWQCALSVAHALCMLLLPPLLGPLPPTPRLSHASNAAQW